MEFYLILLYNIDWTNRSIAKRRKIQVAGRMEVLGGGINELTELLAEVDELRT